MNWAASNLSREWKRFYQHCEFTGGGPLSKCTEKEKICNLMSFIGDKGWYIYLTFQWKTVQDGTGEDRQDVNEKDILKRVAGNFNVYLEAKKNPIIVAVKFDRIGQLQGEMFDSFVTDLKLLARGLDMTESDKLIWTPLLANHWMNEYGNADWKKEKTLPWKQLLTSAECSKRPKTGCR